MVRFDIHLLEQLRDALVDLVALEEHHDLVIEVDPERREGMLVQMEEPDVRQTEEACHSQDGDDHDGHDGRNQGSDEPSDEPGDCHDDQSEDDPDDPHRSVLEVGTETAEDLWHGDTPSGYDTH